MKLKKIFGALLFSLCVVFAGKATVSAAEVPDYKLQISPVMVDVELKAGTNETFTFEVQNAGLKAYNFKIGVTPYSVNGDDYSPDYTTTTSYNNISKWITFSQDEGRVEPGERFEITATINVPDDVASGGQYAMVYAQMAENTESSGSDSGEGDNSVGVSINQRVGLIVYSEVEGDTREEGQILENKIPSILFNPPVIATSLVENTGNVHTKASYVLQVFPLFSDEEVYTNEENPTELYILPETQRFNSISWDGAPQLGIFRVKQTVKIFDEVSTTEKIVFLCPIWFLFLILLIIFCVIFWLISRARARKTNKPVKTTGSSQE